MSHAFQRHTWWELRLEHVQSYHVDDEHPYGALKQVGFRSHEYDSAQALHFQSPSVRIGPSRFSLKIRLEFVHVEQLKRETGNVQQLRSAFHDIKEKAGDCVTQLWHQSASPTGRNTRKKNVLLTKE